MKGHAPVRATPRINIMATITKEEIMSLMIPESWDPDMGRWFEEMVFKDFI
jgi:hypothetical protein